MIDSVARYYHLAELCLLMVYLLGLALAVGFRRSARSASVCVILACLTGIFVALFRVLTSDFGKEESLFIGTMRSLSFLLLLVGVYAGRSYVSGNGVTQQSIWHNWISLLRSRPGVVRGSWTAFFFVALLIFITSLLVTFVLPEYYASYARIRINENYPTQVEVQSANGEALPHDPNFLLTEVELIRSQLVLEKVVADQNLTKIWGDRFSGGPPLRTAECVRMLMACSAARPVRNTSLIEIQVMLEDAKQAADLANAIATAYQDFRIASLRALQKSRIQVLDENFKELEQDIREREDKLVETGYDLNGPAGSHMVSGSAPQVRAKRSLDNLINLRDTVQRRIRDELISLGIPRPDLVEIVDRAEPNFRPVKPNKTLNIVLGLAFGIFFGFVTGGLVLLTGLRSVINQAQTPPPIPTSATNN